MYSLCFPTPWVAHLLSSNFLYLCSLELRYMLSRYLRQYLKFQLKFLILSQALNFQSAKMPTQVEVVFLFSLSCKFFIHLIVLPSIF